MERYRTLKGFGRGEIVAKRSRFIASAAPAETEDDAARFIEEIRREFHDASHNAYAYQIGQNDGTRRFSDDGEPQGSAGKRILDVLRSQELKNCAVVVTRYFGGVKLGLGGLARAYGEAAMAGIEAAGIAEMGLHEDVCFRLDYSTYARIEGAVRGLGAARYEPRYLDAVEVYISVPADIVGQLEVLLNGVSGGEAQLERLGTRYLPLKVHGDGLG